MIIKLFEPNEISNRGYYNPRIKTIFIAKSLNLKNKIIVFFHEFIHYLISLKINYKIKIKDYLYFNFLWEIIWIRFNKSYYKHPLWAINNMFNYYKKFYLQENFILNDLLFGRGFISKFILKI